MRTGNGGFDARATIDCDSDGVCASNCDCCRAAGRKGARRCYSHGALRYRVPCTHGKASLMKVPR